MQTKDDIKGMAQTFREAADIQRSSRHSGRDRRP